MSHPSFDFLFSHKTANRTDDKVHFTSINNNTWNFKVGLETKISGIRRAYCARSKFFNRSWYCLKHPVEKAWYYENFLKHLLLLYGHSDYDIVRKGLL